MKTQHIRRCGKSTVARMITESALPGVLRFRVCFGTVREENKEHPNAQHLNCSNNDMFQPSFVLMEVYIGRYFGRLLDDYSFKGNAILWADRQTALIACPKHVNI